MAKIIAQVTLARVDGVPADSVTNVFHFESDEIFGFDEFADEISVVTRLSTFYQAWETYTSTVLDGTGSVKIYNWDDPKPRIPYMDVPIFFTPGSGGMPSEVASCMSFAGVPQSGMSMARRRGRVFLGPLGSNAAEYVAGTLADFTPAAAFRTTVVAAGSTMARGSAGTYRLAVYSPTTEAAGGTKDAAWTDVARIWMDNAFDTIRSRGFKPTTRTANDLP